VEPNSLPARPSLRKVLGVPDGVAVLVGISIGAGIYSTPQIIAGYLGSYSTIVFLWLAVGFFALAGGFVYAELGTRLPETGGEYVYISRAFGPFAGFMFGWSQLFIIRTSTAAGLALITADYLGYFVRLSGLARTLVAFAVLAVLGVANWIGVQRASAFQKVATSLKVSGLILLVALGLILTQAQSSPISAATSFPASAVPLGNLAAALMMIVFTYTGWDRVGYVAGEMKNPNRVVPVSLFVGMGIVIAVYNLTNYVYHRTLGLAGVEQSTIVASDTATRLMGPVGAGFVAVLVMLSTTSSINGTIMTASRAYYAMARDGLFFRWLDYIHPRFRTPARAILVHCIWAGAIILIRRKFETIVAGMVFAVLIFYSLATIALFRLRRYRVGDEKAYRVPFYPVLPALYLAGLVGLLVFRGYFEWQRSLADLAFIATGLPFAVYWVRKRRVLP
jgi:APA family basic amino acid/polyamine antiporter